MSGDALGMSGKIEVKVSGDHKTSLCIHTGQNKSGSGLITFDVYVIHIFFEKYDNKRLEHPARIFK